MSLLEARMALYSEVRARIRTGDVIGTADKEILSWLVRSSTYGEVSHVAVVYRTAHVVELMEAVKVGWFEGRMDVTRLSNRVLEQNRRGGAIWWFPLRPDARARLDEAALIACLARQEGRKYDWWGAFCSATIFRAKPDPHELFCSESVAFGFVMGKLLPETYNYSEATPVNVVALDLYDAPVQLVA